MAITFAINWTPVIVATVVSFLIGWLWYGPLFGKTWMRLMNITPQSMKKMKMKPGTSMVIGFISTLVMIIVLAMVISAVNASTVWLAVCAAFWVWLGFLATTALSSVIWEGKPFSLYLINILHYLVVLLIAAIILSVWA